MTESALKPGTVLLLDVLKHQSAMLFEDPFDIVTCTKLEDVQKCLSTLESAQANGFHAAGFMAYELGFAFEEKLKNRFTETGEPLLWFGLYSEARSLSVGDAKKLLSADANQMTELTQPEFDMDRCDYEKAFAQVQDHLARGDIYQVNLTMRAHFRHYGSPEHVFLSLLRRQPVEFASFVKMNDRTILSLSPELFLERRDRLLRTKPMKGTAPRGRFTSEDGRIARDLANDPKQRSENTMIVDLMRNDLSRIAETGSVKVSSLCEVERYQSLHQMTSTVNASVPESIGFATIIESLFPCGSITGAPKLSAMQIANDLETDPRGVYTGSIGHLMPGADFRLNVAIRTLVLREDGTGVAGTGSGVVYDSGASPEYDECALKLKFMTDQVQDFDLIETMAFAPHEGYLLLDRHLQRLQKSARYFGFDFNEAEIRACLEQVAVEFSSSRRVRLLLSANGGLSVSSTELTQVDQNTVFNLVIAEETTCSSDPFLFHKTTNREFYDTTRRRYQEATGCQEVLFENEHGYLTEGSYMTLFVRKDGRLLTPTLKHGVLPGTFRAGLLETGVAREADLRREDLDAADEIFVGNSVRGLVRGRVMAGAEEGASTVKSETSVAVATLKAG